MPVLKPKSPVGDNEYAGTPKTLRPYLFHGVNAEWREGDEQAIGDCPFCGRDNKFSVNIGSGLWRCFVCNEGEENGKPIHGGNVYTFMRRLHKASCTNTKDYSELIKSRKLLGDTALKEWQVCKGILTCDWLVPGYNADGHLNQLYRYIKDNKTGKHTLYPTPEYTHQLHGVNLFDEAKPEIMVCEGPWDAISLWETLKITKQEDSKYVQTNNGEASLLAKFNVVATPGCNVFSPSWYGLFANKEVYLLSDSDHPKCICPKCKKSYSTVKSEMCPTCGIKGTVKVPPAGYSGLVRNVQSLSRAEEPPQKIYYLNWGEQGYDPTKPSGYDVRDILANGPDPNTRIQQLKPFFNKLSPIPNSWIPGREQGSSAGGVGMDLLDCREWSTLINQWRKAMKWTEGLDRALKFMLAIIVSTKSIGDQLWGKVVGPAACGKSTLCEAVSVNKDYIVAKSTIRGFHSGYKEDKSGKDYSLTAKLNGKTLVTKDGDTLLQSPNLSQILSEGRDIYDGTSRAEYRNNMSNDYEGMRTTWILCGTNSLRSIDSSELGERFLDCVIMEGIDEELEDEILWRVVNRVDRNMGIESGSDAATQNDPELTKAMRLTGGYVGYLRKNANRLLSSIRMPEQAMFQCMTYGKFVAYLRARPSLKQAETSERELASRLVSQHTRLAKCVAAVMNVSNVNEEVMKVVKRVAMDTARGRTFNIVKLLYEAGEHGMYPKDISYDTTQKQDEETKLLRFLKHIGVVEPYRKVVIHGVKQAPRWRLTQRLRNLYETVMEITPGMEEDEL